MVYIPVSKEDAVKIEEFLKLLSKIVENVKIVHQ